MLIFLSISYQFIRT